MRASCFWLITFALDPRSRIEYDKLMSSNAKPHRSRGSSGFDRQINRRKYKHTSRYTEIRGINVVTPDGAGILLGDSNRYGGSRKFLVRLDDGRIRRYSLPELDTGLYDACRVIWYQEHGY